MRRILLLVALAAGVAVVAVPSASALTFVDGICPVQTGGTIKICPQGETGKAYALQLQGRPGTGCVPYVKFSLQNSDLPPGLTLSSDGWIKGTPTTPGTWDFWVNMQDQIGAGGWCADDRSTQREFEITIVPGLQINQRESHLPPAQLGVAYKLQLSVNSGTPTWSVSGSLPAGLNLDANSGLISGTPTAVGDSTFKITATIGSRSDTQTYSLSVAEPLKVAKGGTAGEVGIPFTLTPTATGGRPGYSWALTAGTLPAGFTMNPATGAITGTPTTPGSTPLTLVVTDSIGLQTTVAFKLVVVARIQLVNVALPQAHVGSKYGARLTVSGGVRPRSFTIIGVRSLPAGLKLDKRLGRITGTPRQAGTYRFRVQVTDKLGARSSVRLTLKVGK